MLEQIQQMVQELSPKSYGRWIASRPDLLQWIQQQQQDLNTKSISETVYCVINQCKPTMCACGQPAVFNSVVKGYRKFCSLKCPQKGQKHSQTVQQMWTDSDKLQQMVENRKKTCLQKYGVENAALHPDIKEKTRQTVQARWGADTPFESEIVQQKAAQTNLQKYGVGKPLQSKAIQQKTKDSFKRNHGFANKMQLARAAWENQHGDTNPFEIEAIRNRAFDTMMKKYGVKYAFQDPDLFQKHVSTHLQNWGRANNAQTHLSDEQYQILNNPEQLKALLETKSLSQASVDTGIRKSLIQRYHDRYHMDVIPKQSRSSFEDEISKFLDQHNISYQKNNRKIIAPLELDFVIDDRIAIEFNGLYWHSEIAGKKHRKYHQQKMQQCEAKGITLLTIWDDEWSEKSQICETVILSYLGKNQKIAARKCEIKEISNAEIKHFIDQNHLQSHSNASVNLALFYEDRIVCAMTFAHSRYNKNVEWELLRAVSEIGCVVQGGMSKLWNHFVKNYAPKSVVSYCDRRWFTGGIYDQLGFIKKVSGEPTYWYTNYKQRFHRSGFTKKSLIDRGADANLSEWKIMQQSKWDRVWDCGQDTWIWIA